MTKHKLVTDAQAREVGKLCRDMRLPRAAFQEALTDGTVRNFLKGLIPNPLEYPSWVRGHESPEHEAIELRNPGEVELWLDPRQQNSPYPTGHEVHTTIKKEDLLERSLSFGDLKWYEENQDRIPAEFKGKLVHGWASVVRSSDGSLRVPCLDCDVGRPYVVWYNLVFGWFGYEPAGLRK